MSRRPYEYVSLSTPISPETMPDGLVGARKAKDPHRYPHGVARFDRMLRPAELERFKLVSVDPLDPVNVMRVLALFKDSVLTEFQQKHIVVLPTRTGSVSLTRSTRAGVKYQLTRWDANQEPVGHLDLQDLDTAVRELSSSGLRPEVRAEFVRMAVPDA